MQPKPEFLDSQWQTRLYDREADISDCVQRCGQAGAAHRSGSAATEGSVVVLSFFTDRRADEVGAELSIGAGNVRVIRHRALARLRECMGAGKDER